MGYKAIIVEDETKSAKALQTMLATYCPELTVVKIFSDSLNALEYLLLNKPDLVFLDIQMPRLTGIDLFKKFKNPEFHVIFTTAHDQFAIDAIKLEALDYLLKPIDSEDLQEAVNRFSHKSMILKNQEQSAQKEMIVKNEENKLIVKLQNQILFLNIKDILYLEADSNYTKFHLANGKSHLASKTIKFFETKINSSKFFRSHQSYLVNTNYIKAYSRTDNCVVLENEKNIPVSRNKKDALLKMLVR